MEHVNGVHGYTIYQSIIHILHTTGRFVSPSLTAASGSYHIQHTNTTVVYNASLSSLPSSYRMSYHRPPAPSPSVKGA